MSKITASKPKRHVIAIDPEDAAALAEMAPQVGVPNIATLTRMGFRYIFRKIRQGELVNVNGELVPAASSPKQ